MNHILIVEDDREIAENLLFLLGKEGFSVETAATREEALDKISGKRFDLILMDVMLPDGNGYSLCTTIKRENDIPVIFLTAMGDEGSIVTGFDLGADNTIPSVLSKAVWHRMGDCGKIVIFAQSLQDIGNLPDPFLSHLRDFLEFLGSVRSQHPVYVF